MDVSVCIVNWNTRDLLEKCLRSIAEKTSGVSYEVIIVDNNSEDGSIEMVLSGFAHCRLIANKKNMGFVRANNQAVGESVGKYILYLNPDTELISNAIFGMHKALESKANYGAVGCRLVNSDGRVQFTCASTYPTPLNEISSLLLLNRIFPKTMLFSERELGYWDHENSLNVNCLSGACMMVRKEIIDKLNGFDEKIEMYAEDVDLCYRILMAGWQIYYLSTEIIMHHEGSSTKRTQDSNFSSLMQRESNVYFLRKNFGLAQATLYKLVVFVGSIYRLFLLLLIYPYLISGMGRKDLDASIISSKYVNLALWSLGLKKKSIPCRLPVKDAD